MTKRLESYYVKTLDGTSYLLYLPVPQSKYGFALSDGKIGYEGGIFNGVTLMWARVEEKDVPAEALERLKQVKSDWDVGGALHNVEKFVDAPDDDDESHFQFLDWFGVVGTDSKGKKHVRVAEMKTKHEAMRVLLTAVRAGWSDLRITEYQTRECLDDAE